MKLIKLFTEAYDLKSIMRLNNGNFFCKMVYGKGGD